eukprot:UN04904
MKSMDFAKVLYRTYFGEFAVNAKDAKFIRKCWYEKFNIEKDPTQRRLHNILPDPIELHHNECVMKGNNKDLFCNQNIHHQYRENMSLFSDKKYEDQKVDPNIEEEDF